MDKRLDLDALVEATKGHTPLPWCTIVRGELDSYKERGNPVRGGGAHCLYDIADDAEREAFAADHALEDAAPALLTEALTLRRERDEARGELASTGLALREETTFRLGVEADAVRLRAQRDRASKIALYWIESARQARGYVFNTHDTVDYDKAKQEVRALAAIEPPAPEGKEGA